MITIYLVRHGQTKENLQRIFQGHLPGTLTDEGKRQARELNKKLKDIHFDLIISSDLQRVVDTVKLATEGRSIPWHTTQLLREIDWGSITGKLISEVDTHAFPPDVETREQLYDRAAAFVSEICRPENDNLTILVVGHGLINRSVQANIEGVPISDLKSIPVQQNAEIRILKLTPHMR